MLKRVLLFAHIVVASALAMDSGDSTAQSLLPRVIEMAGDQFGPLVGTAQSDLRLGESIPLWRISRTSAAAYLSSGQLSDLLGAPQSRFYPILTHDGVLRALLRIEKGADGRWVTPRVGFASLVAEIAQIQAQWPASQGHAVQLVENMVSREVFFHVANLATPNLTRINLNTNRSESAESSELPKYTTLGSAVEEAFNTLNSQGE